MKAVRSNKRLSLQKYRGSISEKRADVFSFYPPTPNASCRLLSEGAYCGGTRSVSARPLHSAGSWRATTRQPTAFWLEAPLGTMHKDQP